ncbi:MAG: fluoride efflux transporter CrcB [Pelagibacterales bacterium]|nr:fluoride efflux transporter CrcB [Pelagibacterales bacterium]
MNKARKMYLIISIAIGGAIGATSRYIISTAIQNLSSNAFPYGMLACNVLGSLILGMLYDSLAKAGIFTDNIKAFIQIGILGSFTTFSAFSLEAFLMFEKGDHITAIVFILLSVLLSISGLVLGLNVLRLVF